MCHLTFINKNIFSVRCSRFSRRHRHPWRTWRLGVHSSSPYDALLRQVLMFWHFSSSHFGNLIFCRPLASSSAPRTADRSSTFSVHPSGCDAPAGFCRSTRWPRSGLRKINIITDFFRPYFCPLPFRLDTEIPSVFLLAFLACARYLRAWFSILLYHIILCTLPYSGIYAGKGYGRGVHEPPMFQNGICWKKPYPYSYPYKYPKQNSTRFCMIIL